MARDVSATSGHIPSLDGLRAVSIGIVLLSHFVDSTLFPGGFGVNVFFVISGFLITRLLLAEHKLAGRIDIRAFYLRRILRLYPVIIAYTALVMGTSLIFGFPVNVIEPLSALFYFANYFYSASFLPGHTEPVMPFAIFWSLSVEEHFYLLFPLTFALTVNRGKTLLAVISATIIASLAARLVLAGLRPDLLRSYVFYYQTQFRADSIACGVLLAILCELRHGRKIVSWLTQPVTVLSSLIVILACFAIRDPWFRETLRYSLISLGLVAPIAALVFTDRYWPANAFLNSAPMVAIGRLSYSLYVWHLLVPIWLDHAGFPELQSFRILIEFAASLLIAAASFYLVERPFLRMRRRYGSRAPAAGLS